MYQREREAVLEDNRNGARDGCCEEKWDEVVKSCAEEEEEEW